MQLTKTYPRATFAPSVIQAALIKHFETEDFDTGFAGILTAGHSDDSRWFHDTYSDWVSEYRSCASAKISRTRAKDRAEEVEVGLYHNRSEVSISSANRSKILATFHIFDDAHASSKWPEPAPKPVSRPRVFIGHGGSKQWRDLKDHLQDKHEVEVIAYETGARSGHAIRDVLESMLDSSSMAFLVMTAEDETADGRKRARQNVVHEVGLFQGRLGFSRAIVILEKGCEEFSNINGIDQIRYGEGNISETYGHVLAAIRREHSGGRE